MKIKTGELIGAALDWAVMTCEDGTTNPLAFTGESRPRLSESWATCGPIIEREKIETRESQGKWIAMWWADNSGMAKNPAQRFEFNYMTKGPTPLVAAMRAYVASKLGDEVDVPDALV